MPEPTTSTAVSTELNSQDVLDELIANGGDYALTVERLKVTKAQFVRTLVEKPAETYSALRMSATLQAFDAMYTLQQNLVVKSEEMDGAEIARALQGMMGHVETLTKPQGAGVGQGASVINVLLQHVPREAANAIKGVAAMDMEDLHDIRRLLKMREAVNEGPTEADYSDIENED